MQSNNGYHDSWFCFSNLLTYHGNHCHGNDDCKKQTNKQKAKAKQKAIIGKLSLPWHWKQSNNGYHDTGSSNSSIKSYWTLLKFFI